MQGRLLVFLACCAMGGPLLAEEPKWSPSAPVYVPYWALPGAAQQVPPQYAVPRYVAPANVPFPMPFWFWYAPPPWVQAPPTTVPDAALAGQVRPGSEPPLPMAPQSAPQAMPPAQGAALPEQTPALLEAALPIVVTTPIEVVAPVVKPMQEEVKSAEQAVAPPAARAVKAKPLARTASKNPKKAAARPLAPVEAKPAAASAAVQPVAHSKPVKRARKLCWKDGRLDVCE